MLEKLLSGLAELTSQGQGALLSPFCVVRFLRRSFLKRFRGAFLGLFGAAFRLVLGLTFGELAHDSGAGTPREIEQ